MLRRPELGPAVARAPGSSEAGPRQLEVTGLGLSAAYPSAEECAGIWPRWEEVAKGPHVDAACPKRL